MLYDVKLLVDKYNTHKEIQRNSDTIKEVGLEVNIEKTKYMLLSCHQNAGKNSNIRTVNISFEKVVSFKYFEPQSEIKILL
jgi:hypothetical protein